MLGGVGAQNGLSPNIIFDFHRLGWVYNVKKKAILALIKESTKPKTPESATTATNVNELHQQMFAMQSVLKAHNITFDVSKADLSKIIVDDAGQVTGEFKYTAPTPANPDKKDESSQNSGDPLTPAEIAKLSPEQINERWKEVSAALVQ